MESTRDSSPDSGCVRDTARPPLTARPRCYPISASEPRAAFYPRRKPLEFPGIVFPCTDPSTASPLSARQLRPLDGLRVALRSRHYSPRNGTAAGQPHGRRVPRRPTAPAVDTPVPCSGATPRRPRRGAAEPSLRWTYNLKRGAAH
jgi:hypothetical protein